MFHIALYQPEIPPNTGNIIRLCANTGAKLHLIHPLGFSLHEKALRRAGLDYHEWASISQYENWETFIQQHDQKRIYACSARAKKCYSTVQYTAEDMFLFGPESNGLPNELLQKYTSLYIPMRENNRSLNLSNAVAVVLYEAWKQLDFD
ncbi:MULTISPECIES: tRNA (cytidine(34)-2'-O)-methyltransferase [Legionella]|uniref:tRNA (cytidine(34)-2'-O)-methyltransferase n=1 Tax=Legionella resiliens TaxID=2905958 RepID=A0ABS8X436_9GAMM|nr:MULTISPECIES: tRNA (cytidine(34)-2'-O)-methyltransferase [unclassified Legionella]MCE0724384.1 tRNA (cytidine(34)-2'-O)-methyltransferase [Legionella sp. 9fVS26]MCE3533536.1 tRNA (cytidine(34)-2'-O)-methyltransferase [Legionella sp. 8cVS16]QLZ69724.1 tRNA (cytidine(34)-2'-O)-methyltransferase [Legionella sp. PC1000]